MGKRGPRPKPSALKRQQGTWRPDRAASNEMAPMAGVPVCPPHLDAVAKAEWDRIVPELEATGVLTVVDGAGLEAYCANYAMAVWFQDVASKSPMIKVPKGIDRKTGQVVYTVRANPAVAEARRHWQLVRQFLSEFGMTPAARTRVSRPDGAGEGDDAAEFLFGPLRVVDGGAGGK